MSDTEHLHQTMPNASEALLQVRLKVEEIDDQWGGEHTEVDEALWQVQKAITQVQLEITERLDERGIEQAAGETP